MFVDAGGAGAGDETWSATCNVFGMLLLLDAPLCRLGLSTTHLGDL